MGGTGCYTDGALVGCQMGMEDCWCDLDATDGDTTGMEVSMLNSFHHMIIIFVGNYLMFPYHEIQEWETTQVHI